MRDTQNIELQNAWDTVPEVKEGEARYAAAQRRLRGNITGLAPDEARAAVVEESVTQFMATGSWPKDVGARAADAYVAALASDAETRALKRAVVLSRAAKEDIRNICADSALAFLGKRLAETLDAARTARDALDGVTSDTEAIETGGEPLEAWRRLMALRKDLENIRTAQFAILRSVALDGPTVARLERAGHGQVSGLPVDEVPFHGTYDIEYLLWLAAQPTAYVPASLGDLEADVEANQPGPAVWNDQGPMRDYTPTATPIQTPAPAAVYPHSRAPQLDNSGPQGRVTANATPGDPAPWWMR